MTASSAPFDPSVLFCRVVDFLLRAILRTMWFAGGFHRVIVKGRQALPTEAAILTLAPHSSYFDAIPITMTMSSIVMKAESRDIPIWGSKCPPQTPGLSEPHCWECVSPPIPWD